MKKNNFLFPAALAALILSDPALAAAGTQSLNNTLQTILSVFQGASLLSSQEQLFGQATECCIPMPIFRRLAAPS